MKTLILSVWLGVEGYLDFKYKEIPLWLSVAGGMLGVFFCVLEKRSLMQVLLALVPGVVALIFSWVTKEIMGYGDGIALLVLGFYMSWSQLLSTGMLAFCLAGLVALVLLVVFRKRGRYRIPFIPFLGFAYAIENVTAWGNF